MQKSPYIILFHKLKKYYIEVAIVMLAIAATSGSLLSFGHILKSLIDSGIAEKNINKLNSALVHMLLAVLVLGIGSFLRSFFIYSVSNKIVSEIRITTYQSLLSRPSSYFDTMKISDINSRFSHDLSLIGDIITNLLSFSIRNSFTIIGGLTMMLLQNIKLSLIVIIVLPTSLILIKIIGKKVRALAKELQEKKASLEELIGETLSNIRVVNAFNIKKYVTHKLLTEAQKSDEVTYKYLKLRASFFAISIFIITSLLIMVLWIGGIDVLEGKISSGNMVSFIFYAIVTAFAIGGLAEVFGDLQKSFAGAERIFELQSQHSILNPPSSSIPTQSSSMPTQSSSSGVTRGSTNSKTYLTALMKDFAYNARPDVTVVKDIRLEANLGEFIGIAGPSGSGKSTLIQLIMGIYTSPNCHVLINNEELDSTKLSEVIAYVPQDPFLFSTSIRENITLGRDLGSLDKVIEITGLDSVIKDLPQGIDTYVGEKAMQLSGGQKQRISIARSLYGNPSILLLDEATSALDMKSEHMVLHNIKKLMKNKIIISVAHRLSSIKDADRIILIHNGIIISEGPHEQLLKDSPLYKHLVSIADA